MRLNSSKARKPAAVKATESDAPAVETVETVAPAVTVADAPAESATDAATDAPAAVAPAYKTAARDAATVAAQATHFAQYSDRDTAYLVFFGLAMRPRGNTATLAQIHESGKPAASGNRRSNPFYTGSAKATDAGAINRLVKAGYIIASESGNRLTATEKAIASGAYNQIPIASE